MPLFNVTLAMNICVYSSSEVEADTIAEAVELVRANASEQTGPWDNGFECDWSSPTEQRIVEIYEEGSEDYFDFELTDPTSCHNIISAEHLKDLIQEAAQ